MLTVGTTVATVGTDGAVEELIDFLVSKSLDFSLLLWERERV